MTAIPDECLNPRPAASGPVPGGDDSGQASPDATVQLQVVAPRPDRVTETISTWALHRYGNYAVLHSATDEQRGTAQEQVTYSPSSIISATSASTRANERKRCSGMSARSSEIRRRDGRGTRLTRAKPLRVIWRCTTR